MQGLLANTTRKQIVITILLAVSLGAILLSLMHSSAPSTEMNFYNANNVSFDYPRWLSLNNTPSQLVKLNKNDDLFIVWKFPLANESLKDYGAALASHNFGRKIYTSKSSTMKTVNNMDWYINCGDGVTVDGKKVEDCYALTRCDSMYIIQITTLRGTSLQKKIFDNAVNSFECLRS